MGCTRRFLPLAFRRGCSINHWNKQRWYYLRSAKVVAFKFGFLSPAFGGCSYLNNDDQRLVQFLCSTWAVLFTIELFLPSSWGYHTMINDNRQHRSYLGSSSMIPSIFWSFRSASWCWYLMNYGNHQQCVEYLRFFMALLSARGAPLHSFWSCRYTWAELQWTYYYRPIIAFLSTIVTVLWVFWSWWWMHDNTLYRCYYLRSAIIAVISTKGFLVWVLLVGYSIDDEYWSRCNFLESVLIVLSTLGSFSLAAWRWYSFNDDHYDWLRWYFLRSKIAVFTAVESFPLSFWCRWYFMNNGHRLGWNYLWFAARVSVDGSFFPTVWRWHYDRNDYEKQRLYCLAFSITELVAIGSYLAAFWCCDYMKADYIWWRFLHIFVRALLSITGFILVFWLCFDLCEENQQCGHRLRSTITERTIGFCLSDFFRWHYWYHMNDNQQLWYWLRYAVTLLLTMTNFKLACEAVIIFTLCCI